MHADSAILSVRPSICPSVPHLVLYLNNCISIKILTRKVHHSRSDSKTLNRPLNIMVGKIAFSIEVAVYLGNDTS